MGRLGSREMTAASDLDLILLYDFDPEHPDSDGARSLQGSHYFARLTQRLISAFTTRTNYGVCTMSTCGCDRRGGPARWRRISRPSPNIRSAKPGPGSIWR